MLKQKVDVILINFGDDDSRSKEEEKETEDDMEVFDEQEEILYQDCGACLLL